MRGYSEETMLAEQAEKIKRSKDVILDQEHIYHHIEGAEIPTLENARI